jgi:hypothetical protein
MKLLMTTLTAIAIALPMLIGNANIVTPDAVSEQRYH